MNDVIQGGVYVDVEGKVYMVLTLGIHAETKEPMVVYALYDGEGDAWVTTVDLWLANYTLIKP